MQAFLEYIVKGLVDHPEEVRINGIERNGITVYEMRMHPDDIGRVVGRKGAMINAIRTLLLVGSAKKGRRCALELIDHEEGTEGA